MSLLQSIKTDDSIDVASSEDEMENSANETDSEITYPDNTTIMEGKNIQHPHPSNTFSKVISSPLTGNEIFQYPKTALVFRSSG